MIKRLKKNKKGFSLVELIVVIAIMAVLVGVLAPTLLGNIEKSRESKDIQTLDSIASALQTALNDEAGNAAVTDTTNGYGSAMTFTTFIAKTDDFAVLTKEYLGGRTSFTAESAAAKASGVAVYIKVDAATGSVEVFYGTAADAVVRAPKSKKDLRVTR